MGTGEGLSVVIPSRREGPRLLDTLRSARMAMGEGEVVIVASEEPAGVRDAALAEGATWIDSPRPNRGFQLKLGGERARGRHLAFLHADTRLPVGAGGLIRNALGLDGVAAGAFRLRFDRSHPVLDALSWMSRLTLPAAFLGDQCLFCTRAAYEAAGGFRPLPLFEDVDLARRLARIGRLVRLRGEVVTSARRFLSRGPLRQLAANALLLLAYRAGVDPCRLSALYERTVPAGGVGRVPRRGRPNGVARESYGIRRGRRGGG